MKPLMTLTRLVEEAVEVDVDTVPGRRVEQNVLSVTIAKAQDVTDHTHHGGGATVRYTRIVPVIIIKAFL